MRRTIPLIRRLFPLVVAIVLGACGDEPVLTAPPEDAATAVAASPMLRLSSNAPCVITLRQASVSFGPAGGSATVPFTQSGSCPTPVVDASSSWMTASRASATSVRLAVPRNNIGTPRSGEVRLRAGAWGVVLARLSVQQGAATPPEACRYTVTPDRLSLSAGFHQYAISVTPSPGSGCASWHVVPSDSWITLNASYFNGTATVRGSVRANASANARAGTLTLRGARGVSVVIPVVQAGARPTAQALEVHPRSLSLTKASQQMSLRVVSTQCYTVQESATWLSVPTGSHFCGDRTIPLFVQFNTGAARSTVVLVGGVSVTVLQAGTR